MAKGWRGFFGAQGGGVRAPGRVFWVAFAVRLVYMTVAHTYRIRGVEENFNYGWEAGRIAKALVTGYGYADPFANFWLPHTGQTAWLPPVYPLLVAAVFKVFGVYSAASAWVLLAMNCAFSAATAKAVWAIGARCFGMSVARWSAWIWALHPAAMQFAVRWVWETSLTTMLFAWVLVLALRMRRVGDAGAKGDAGGVGRWALFGLAWGVIALSNSTLLLFLPVCGLWLLWGAWPDAALRRRALGGAVVAGLIFIACVAPWTWRNWEAFHAFIPLRGNLGAELCMGDGPGSTGLLMTYLHPHVAPEQLRAYAAMGEVRYVAMRGALAKSYIHARPGHFVAIVLKRVYFYWAGVPSDAPFAVETGRLLNFGFISLAGLGGLGLALRRRVAAAGMFAWAFALLPVTYYAVTVHARFRHPLEPLLCVFGVYLFQSATRRRDQGRDQGRGNGVART